MKSMSGEPASPLHKRLMLGIAATITALVGVELGLRVFAPWGGAHMLASEISPLPSSFFQHDRVLGHRNRPDQRLTYTTVESSSEIRTNAHGMRGPSLHEAPNGALRVMVVGDSFTFAAQVSEPETSTARLGAALSERLQRPVHAVNAGVDAYGVAQSVRLSRELVPAVQPDIIVLNLYTGNDLLDDGFFFGRPPGPPPGEHVAPPEDMLREEQRQIRAGQLARYSRIFAYSLAVKGLYSRDPAMVAMMADELAVFTDPQRQAQLLPHTQRALHEFVSLCHEVRSRCLVSLIPPAYLVHTERLPATLRAAGLGGATLIDDDLFAAIERTVPPAVPVLDLRPALRGAAGQQLYFTFDPHWTAAGHQVVAAAQADALAGQTKLSTR